MLPDIVTQHLPETYAKAMQLLPEHPELTWVQTEGDNGYCDYPSKTFYAPAPMNPTSFQIFTHEIGHLVKSSEETAWTYTRDMIDRFGVPRGAQDQALRSFADRAPAIRNVFDLG
jgi:hypothetical protein